MQKYDVARCRLGKSLAVKPKVRLTPRLVTERQSRQDSIAFDGVQIAIDVMANASQIPDAQEGMQAFLEKRIPNFDD